MPDYLYPEPIKAEIRRCLRGLIPPDLPLKEASLAEDLTGTDVHWVVNQTMPLAVRARFNRPAYASDSDVTFRATEPAMIAAGTYAPLAVFMWFIEGKVVAAKAIDVYRMHEKLVPPLQDRFMYSNGDGTAFCAITIAELHTARALLRQYDGQVWATAILGGEQQLNRILAHHARRRTA
jgi:hypothetical protein